MGAACIRHFPEQLLHLKGFRGGAFRGDHIAADHILIGADQAHLGPPYLLQNGLEQIGGGSLAAGAGDGDHGHLLCGMAEPVPADHRQRPTGILRLNVGARLCRTLLAQHRRRAVCQRLADILMSVCRKARHGYKQVAGLRCPGIIADAGDLHFQICRACTNGNTCKKLPQFHNKFLL